MSKWSSCLEGVCLRSDAFFYLTAIIMVVKLDNGHNNGRNMRTSRTSIILPSPVRRTLRKLGHDMRDARRRRRIPTEVLADRASVSKATLVKIERATRALRSAFTRLFCSP